MTRRLSRKLQNDWSKMQFPPVFSQLKDGLVVSCQALDDEPLHGAPIMAAMARAAVEGGAVGIRANSPLDIAAISAAVSVPVIGLYKDTLPDYAVYITPTLEHARSISAAGAVVIALDATFRSRPGGLDAARIIQLVQESTGKPVLADVATFAEGISAWKAGAAAVSTTLSGYTEDSLRQPGPDFDLLEKLAAELPIPVIAEGRITTPEQAARALELGAFAVVVGGAITRPQWITRQFTARISSRK
jgi:N-acylglucosamine-6-phosphate 2-epimerase